MWLNRTPSASIGPAKVNAILINLVFLLSLVNSLPNSGIAKSKYSISEANPKRAKSIPNYVISSRPSPKTILKTAKGEAFEEK
jgi:hypothetical protein